MQRCWGRGKGFSGEAVEVAIHGKVSKGFSGKAVGVAIHGKVSKDPASALGLLDS